MFAKSRRKKLLEHKWVDILKDSSNATQTWRRIRDEAIRALNDLTLLAKKLPDDEQQELFDGQRIFRLLHSIVKKHSFEDSETRFEAEDRFDGRRAALASMLVNLGTEVCIHQYRLLNKDTPDLGELTTSHLRQSAKICRDIAYRSELMERDMEAERHGMVYLFEWNKIATIPTTQYTRRFADFIGREIKFEVVRLGRIEASKDRKNIRGTFDDIPASFDEIEESDTSWSFVLELNDVETNVDFKAFDINGDQQACKKLMVKRDGDKIYVYEKKKK